MLGCTSTRYMCALGGSRGSMTNAQCSCLCVCIIIIIIATMIATTTTTTTTTTTITVTHGGVRAGVTSGYQPLGGVIVSDRLLSLVSGTTEAEAEGGEVRESKWTVGFTYSGHPVACAAGLANMDLMEETGILAHSRTIGQELQVRG
eukprot:COSAG05_NODE_201_length_14387_cov_59.959476_10_plen_147_part_00